MSHNPSSEAVSAHRSGLAAAILEDLEGLAGLIGSHPDLAFHLELVELQPYRIGDVDVDGQSDYLVAAELSGPHKECLHLAQQMGDVAREVIVTVNIGSVERRFDRLDEALALQRRALRMELATGVIGPVPVSLIALGEQAAIRGWPAIGARIVGAVDGALDRREAMLTVVDAEDRERTPELLRSSLGDEAHAAETAAGRSLGVHEAVELVEQTFGPLT